MSIKKLSAAVTKIMALIAALEAAALTATANAVEMVAGNDYTIITGRAETRAKVKAKLVAQRVNEKGTAQYRFSVGEGFDQRFFDCIAAQVVLGERVNAEGVTVDMLLSQVGGDTPEQVAAKLVIAKAQLVEAQQALAAEEAKNALIDNQTYTIKLPAKKGVEAVQVLAVLLGQTTEGKKVFNFFYGAGVEARTVLRTFDDVVLPVLAGEAAPADGGSDLDVVVTEGAAVDAIMEQPLTDAEGNLTDAGVAAQLAALGADAPVLEQPASV
ncbi:phage protein [Aeromonas phage vB_AspA_Lolek]|nr:phage protein [Aeromonas phage vB_AspA_Lolek]